MNDNLVSPRKRMAMGDSSAGSVMPTAGGVIVHPDADMDSGKTLHPDNRAIPSPRSSGPNRMATAQPADHGPHNHKLGNP